MFDWLAMNFGTILVALVLIGIVSLIVTKMVKDKKKGKSPCGCDCSSCSGACGCHK